VGLSSETFREELNKINLTMVCGAFSQNHVVFYVHTTQLNYHHPFMFIYY